MNFWIGLGEGLLFPDKFGITMINLGMGGIHFSAEISLAKKISITRVGSALPHFRLLMSR